MQNRKELITNVIIFIVVSIVCVIIAESALRIYGIVPSTDRLYAYEFDEMLGWKTQKHFKYFRSTPYYSHFTYYNPDGFPTTKEDWSQRVDAQIPSLVFIGDSFTEGYYLPYQFTFTHLVEKKLGRQVVNLGVSGYAPDQYLLAARTYLPLYNVDTIIVMFFPYNDIPDIFKTTYQGYAKPMFEESLDTPVNLPLPNLKGKPQQENWLQKIAHSSAIYAATRSLVRRYFELPQSSRKPPTFYTKGQMHKALTLIHQIQIEFPVDRFLVYYIPMYAEIATQTLHENVRTFQDVCAELEMSCFSLAKILNDVEDPGQLYMVEEGHFSKKGAEAVATHLYDILGTHAL